MAHIILFERESFRGSHKHVVSAEPNLNAPNDDFFNDRVSSLVVLSGNWALYPNADFKDQYPSVLGPGLYPHVGAGVQHPGSTVTALTGIKNDDMSSLQPVPQRPTAFGTDLGNHVVLFEHGSFHGAHKHVFAPELNLNAVEDDAFNDTVSSLAVLNGNWVFYRDELFHNPYPPVLGPGGWPFVGFVDIANDDMSSLQPVADAPTLRSTISIQPGVVLFKDARFRGAHKHIVTYEGNLNAPDDSAFNDNVSSFAILSGNWMFFRDLNFQNQYPQTLAPGQYASVTDVQIKNDDMSGLGPI